MDKTICVIALDQGTTSTRAIAFDLQGNVIAKSQKDFDQFYPQSGWVEHDGEEIWQSCLFVLNELAQILEAKNIIPKAMGITNQRETVLLWDKVTGAPLTRAIVWQDRRTADFCESLKEKGLEPDINSKTGLILDPYFSASKIAWLLDSDPLFRQEAEQGNILTGTIDSYITYRLSGQHTHITDATNASRTLLMELKASDWSAELLNVFNIPANILPKIVDSAGDLATIDDALPMSGLTINALIGDQQSAAVGQGCLSSGSVKSTYGTGCFILAHTGTEPIHSKNKLLTTVALQVDGQRTFAVEGSIFNAGTVTQWFKDGINIIDDASESEELARSVEDTNGVYMVPAFTGLGAPHWQADARGIIVGIERSTSRAHIVRAGLESIVFQTNDLIDCMIEDGCKIPDRLLVDGGMANNAWFLEYLAKITGAEVFRPESSEATALGAAIVAAYGAGLIDKLSFENMDTGHHYMSNDNDQQLRISAIGGWRQVIKTYYPKN